MLAEKRFPTREDLDQVSTEHPIMIIHISGHFDPKVMSMSHFLKAKLLVFSIAIVLALGISLIYEYTRNYTIAKKDDIWPDKEFIRVFYISEKAKSFKIFICLS